MSSNSSGVNNQLIQEFGGSLFHWLSTNVLPFALGSVLALMVTVGVILNIILLVVYGKRKLYKDATQDFFPQIAIVDLLASFLVVIPSSVSALMDEWPLSSKLCTIHGVLVSWFHLMSFALIIMIFVERVVKAWNPGLHSGTFNRRLFVVILSAFVWAGHLLFSLLPILGIGTIEFNSYQSQCSLLHAKHRILSHVMFTMGLYCSPIICLICFSLLIENRRRKLVNTDKEEKNKLISLKEEEEGFGSGGKKNPMDAVKNGPSKAWDQPNKNAKAPLFNSRAKGKDKAPLKKKLSRVEFLEQYNRRMNRPRKDSLVSKMFKDDGAEKDHHQAMTALITWLILEICWVWYLVAAMLEMYSGADVWGGWHIIGVLMGDITYCIKPIIYLAHNRHYRNASVQTMPKNVRDVASNVARKVSEAVKKMDNVLFVSPATKKPKLQKLHTAITVRLLALRWKRRAGIGMKKLGNKLDPNNKQKPPGKPQPAQPDTYKPGEDDKNKAPGSARTKPPSSADTLSGPPMSPGSRPVTKSGVNLSVGEPPSSPPSAPNTARDDDLAVLMNPHAPQW